MNMIRFCIGRPRLRPINQTSEPRHNTPRHIARRMRQNNPHHLSEPLTAKANIPPRRKHTHLTSSVIFPEAVVWYPTWESENKRPTEQLHALPAPPGPRQTNEALTSYYSPPPGPPKLLQPPLLIHGINKRKENEWSEKLRFARSHDATRQNNARTTRFASQPAVERRSDGPTPLCGRKARSNRKQRAFFRLTVG